MSASFGMLSGPVLFLIFNFCMHLSNSSFVKGWLHSYWVTSFFDFVNCCIDVLCACCVTFFSFSRLIQVLVVFCYVRFLGCLFFSRFRLWLCSLHSCCGWLVVFWYSRMFWNWLLLLWWLFLPSCLLCSPLFAVLWGCLLLFGFVCRFILVLICCSFFLCMHIQKTSCWFSNLFLFFDK